MSSRIKTAFVLAAGLGTRMRPLTDQIPKPLVRLAGRTLLDRVLDRLAAAGIERAVVNVHYHADLIERHLKKRDGGPRIEISDERDALLETGGGVVRALEKLGSEPFLIHNSDTVWIEGVGSNLERLIAGYDAARMDSLMLLATAANSIGYEGAGDFVMDAGGRLTRRGERQVAPFVFAGASIAHPRLFEDMREERFSLNVPWDKAIDAGRLYGLRLEGTWMHVGTPASLAAAEQRLDLEDAR